DAVAVGAVPLSLPVVPLAPVDPLDVAPDVEPVALAPLAGAAAPPPLPPVGAATVPPLELPDDPVAPPPDAAAPPDVAPPPPDLSICLPARLVASLASDCSRLATSDDVDMSRKMSLFPSSARAPAIATGSGADGGFTMLTIELGNAVGVVEVCTSRVPSPMSVIAGALSGSGDFCQSQNRVSSMTSAALQWPSLASANMPRVGRLTTRSSRAGATTGSAGMVP